MSVPKFQNQLRGARKRSPESMPPGVRTTAVGFGNASCKGRVTHFQTLPGECGRGYHGDHMTAVKYDYEQSAWRRRARPQVPTGTMWQPYSTFTGLRVDVVYSLCTLS